MGFLVYVEVSTSQRDVKVEDFSENKSKEARAEKIARKLELVKKREAKKAAAKKLLKKKMRAGKNERGPMVRRRRREDRPNRRRGYYDSPGDVVSDEVVAQDATTNSTKMEVEVNGELEPSEVVRIRGGTHTRSDVDHEFHVGCLWFFPLIFVSIG